MTGQVSENHKPPSEDLNRLLALHKNGQFYDAEILALSITKYFPQHSLGWQVLGDLFRLTGRKSQALKAHQVASQLIPEDPGAHFNLGISFQQLEDMEQAEASYIRCIELKPDFARAHYNLGTIYQDTCRLEDAKESYNLSIKFDPNYAPIHNNLGNVLKDLDQLDEALESYHQAITLKPDFSEAHCNLGLLFVRSKEFTKAENQYHKALSINPNLTDAKRDLAQLLLTLARFEKGFKWYESRYAEGITDKSSTPPNTTIPQYQGNDIYKDLKDKHLLICPEQGVGDEVMFASVLPELACLVTQNPKTRITLACDKRLVELFSRSFNFLTVIPKDQDHCYKGLESDVDYWLFIGSLPKLFRHTIEDFNNHQPYLAIEKNLAQTWKQRFNNLEHNFNVGISWRGGLSERKKADRSLSLEELLPMLTHVSQSANIINLQYGDHKQEINDFSAQTGITIFDWEDCDPLKDLDNFSAQISALDLVISIDNSTVHFAGALGTKTYVMLPFSQDWRWGENDNSSYWYPNVLTLFRQTQTGEWTEVIETLTHAIDEKGIEKGSSNLLF